MAPNGIVIDQLLARLPQLLNEKAKDENFPVFFFRFEDLVTVPEVVLKEVFAFSLERENIDSTVL